MSRDVGGRGGDDHRRGRERATRTSTRGTSLALVSPLSRPTLSNRSPALLLSPLYPLDPMPTGPLARSPASSTPPRASTALPGPPLNTPASPTRRRSQSLAPLTYYDLEPLLRHASLNPLHGDLPALDAAPGRTLRPRKPCAHPLHNSQFRTFLVLRRRQDSAHAQPYACSRPELSCASPPLLMFPLSTLQTLAA